MKMLSRKQAEAINSSGRTIIKACPGSGKTFTMANKIIDEGLKWKRKNSGMAILSFTNVASKELEKQIDDVCKGYKIEYPHYLGTIDSFFSQFICLPFAHLILNNIQRPTIINGFSSSIYRFATEKLWKRECHTSFCRPENFYFDSNGNLKYSDKKKNLSDCKVTNKPCLKLKNDCYQQGLLNHNDVVSLTLRLLKDNENMVKLICNKFPFIIIDEAQDTSEEQMQIFDILANNGVENIFLIGDDNQAIYEWRDADPDIFINKLTDSSWNSKFINENYRCSQNICNATNVFSTLPEVSVAVGNTKGCNFKPRVFKYDVKNKEQLIEQFLDICSEQNVLINHDNVAVLSRGISGLLGKDYRNIENLWQNILTKLLSELSFEKSNGSLNSAINLSEIILYYLLVDSNKLAEIDESKIYKNFNYDKWQKMIKNFCRNMPPSSIILSQWKNKIIDYLETFAKDNSLNFIVNHEIKIKTSDKNAPDFLEQPVDVFYFNSYVSKHLNATIHAVKGRTFDAVLLIIGQNGKLTSNLLNTKPIESEVVRTAYVAMTRAKKILVVGVPKTIKNKDMPRFDNQNWDFENL